MKIKAKIITDEALIQSVHDANIRHSSVRYGFFLGAGASASSDIPVAKTLCNIWLKIIKKNSPNLICQKWEESNIAEFYSDIFDSRFKANVEIGYDELQDYINRAEPSIGYLFLAQILSESKNKFIITTNFDTVIEDALFSLNQRPLVIGHESLAEFSQTNNPTRPVIIKVHRDFLLKPFNIGNEVQQLSPNFKKMLNPILKEINLIVLGYGGNDDSIMNYLKGQKARKPIYWCCLNKYHLSDKVKRTLTKKDFIVEIKSFDRFMLMLNRKFGFDNLIDKEEINDSVLIKNAQKQTKRYQKQLEALSKKDLELKEIEAIKEQLPYWWDYEIQISREQNTNKQNQLYIEGLKKHPNSHELMGNYAIFLYNIRQEYDQAEDYYQKALKLDPDSANKNSNYANFLKNIRQEYDQAGDYYKKALKLDPDSAINNGNYANFLSDIRQEYDQAEDYYKKALKLEPDNATYNGNYANFLSDIRQKYDQAENYYQKTLKLDSDDANNNGNYAGFLLAQGKLKQAEKYLEIAFEYANGHQDLLLELWFYRLAHYSKYRKQAITKLDALLENGAKSIGWDFTANIKQAEIQGFKPMQLLYDYADKINHL